MGKLMQSTQIKHSSHPHFLQLSSTIHLHNQPSIHCCGCNLQISPSENTYYTCAPCGFALHASCAKFPDLITHSSHGQHTLSLLPTSIYPGGFFRCDACCQQGNRFSYHCQICDFDLHALCASKPLSVTHPSHPHPLLLTFSSPYGEKLGFSCDVCSSVGSSDQWLYRCVSCEFDVHLQCATATPHLQHQHSYPGATPVTHPNQFVTPAAAGQPLMHSMSTGHVQGSWQPQQAPAPGGLQSYQLPSQQPPPAPGGFQNYQSPSHPPAPVGGQCYQMPPQPSGPAVVNPSAGSGNGLGNVMVTGFVDSMMQQLGQNFVQSLTGGGSGGGGGGGGIGDSNGDGGNVDYQSITIDNYDSYDS